MRTRSSRVGQSVRDDQFGIAKPRTRTITEVRIPQRGGRMSVATIGNRAEDWIDRFLRVFATAAPMALRLSLALIFLWFGLLKVTGASPVAQLVAATLPWANANLVVHLLGCVEVVLAVGLLIGRAQRVLLLALCVHLSGTFLTFVMAPSMTMRHGDPLLLTADGEFVIKNLVLISAALFLASHRYAQGNRARLAIEQN